MARRQEHNPGIEHEPFLQQQGFEIDPSEQVAARNVPATAEEKLDERAQSSVWDEPALSPMLSGEAPEGELTYGRWLSDRIATTRRERSWLVTLLVTLAAGPWAILGAFMAVQPSGGVGILMMIIVAPVTEEIMKIAAALWVVEKKPYLFKLPIQLLICALLGGVTFGVIENLIYLNVYIKNPPINLILWRWTICTLLHTSCSFIAGWGLMRMWRESVSTLSPPQLTRAAPFFIAAMITHGIYNTLAVVMEMAGVEFLK